MKKQKIVEEVARALRRPKIEDATWDALGSSFKEYNRETMAKLFNDEYERRTKSR
jgi:hypothetical protein